MNAYNDTKDTLQVSPSRHFRLTISEKVQSKRENEEKMLKKKSTQMKMVMSTFRLKIRREEGRKRV